MRDIFLSKNKTFSIFIAAYLCTYFTLYGERKKLAISIIYILVSFIIHNMLDKKLLGNGIRVLCMFQTVASVEFGNTAMESSEFSLLLVALIIFIQVLVTVYYVLKFEQEQKKKEHYDNITGNIISSLGGGKDV